MFGLTREEISTIGSKRYKDAFVDYRNSVTFTPANHPETLTRHVFATELDRCKQVTPFAYRVIKHSYEGSFSEYSWKSLHLVERLKKGLYRRVTMNNFDGPTYDEVRKEVGDKALMQIRFLSLECGRSACTAAAFGCLHSDRCVMLQVEPSILGIGVDQACATRLPGRPVAVSAAFGRWQCQCETPSVDHYRRMERDLETYETLLGHELRTLLPIYQRSLRVADHRSKFSEIAKYGASKLFRSVGAVRSILLQVLDNNILVVSRIMGFADFYLEINVAALGSLPEL
jgi:hypothetical protein